MFDVCGVEVLGRLVVGCWLCGEVAFIDNRGGWGDAGVGAQFEVRRSYFLGKLGNNISFKLC